MPCVQYDEARPFSQPAAGHPQIGLVNLRNYALVRWGGQDLGIYANRAIIGSSRPSIHRDGRAWDYRAPSRAVLESFWAFCIQYADPLNIQAIHDYARGRLWRTCQGWHSGNIGVGAGGAYTHVERNWAGAKDARTITQIVGGVPPIPPIPEPGPPPAPVPLIEELPQMILFRVAEAGGVVSFRVLTPNLLRNVNQQQFALLAFTQHVPVAGGEHIYAPLEVVAMALAVGARLDSTPAPA